MRAWLRENHDLVMILVLMVLADIGLVSLAYAILFGARA